MRYGFTLLALASVCFPTNAHAQHFGPRGYEAIGGAGLLGGLVGGLIMASDRKSEEKAEAQRQQEYMVYQQQVYAYQQAQAQARQEEQQRAAQFDQRELQLGSLQAACRLGDNESCLRSGGRTDNQMGVANILMQACRDGDQRSCSRVAVMMNGGSNLAITQPLYQPSYSAPTPPPPAPQAAPDPSMPQVSQFAQRYGRAAHQNTYPAPQSDPQVSEDQSAPQQPQADQQPETVPQGIRGVQYQQAPRFINTAYRPIPRPVYRPAGRQVCWPTTNPYTGQVIPGRMTCY